MVRFRTKQAINHGPAELQKMCQSLLKLSDCVFALDSVLIGPEPDEVTNKKTKTSQLQTKDCVHFFYTVYGFTPEILPRRGLSLFPSPAEFLLT